MSPDIRHQIELTLKIPEVQDNLFKNVTKVNHPSADISNISDSESYKKLKAEDSQILTLNFNTDGTSIFKSSKQNFLPQHLYINELSLETPF